MKVCVFYELYNHRMNSGALFTLCFCFGNEVNEMSKNLLGSIWNIWCLLHFVWLKKGTQTISGHTLTPMDSSLWPDYLYSFIIIVKIFIIFEITIIKPHTLSLLLWRSSLYAPLKISLPLLFLPLNI